MEFMRNESVMFMGEKYTVVRVLPRDYVIQSGTTRLTVGKVCVTRYDA